MWLYLPIVTCGCGSHTTVGDVKSSGEVTIFEAIWLCYAIVAVF